MLSKLIALGFGALAFAAPLSSSADAPCLSADFSLAMRVNAGEEPIYASLSAVDSGTNGTLFLVGEKLSRYPGTPVAVHGKSGNASLTVQVTSKSDDCHTVQHGNFGISVPDLGELYGVHRPAIATLNQPWPHFYYSGGDIEPMRTAASQLWYACNMTIQGLDYLALHWGVYNDNGTSPYGCSPTEVIQIFNIPCGEAS